MIWKLKTFIAASSAAISLGLAAPASAAFVGAYDVANWSLSAPDGGSVDISGAPNSFSLTGSDTGSGNNAFTVFSITAQGSGMVSFNFGYLTRDLFGGLQSPALDPAGYVLNGTFVQLSIDEFTLPVVDPIPNPQSGIGSFSVAAGDTFGFYVNSLDSSNGEAILTVSNFNGPLAAVPEPASLALFGLGLAGLVASRRRTSA